VICVFVLCALCFVLGAFEVRLSHTPCVCFVEQTLQEVRHLLVWAYECAHKDWSHADKAELKMTALPAYSIVQGALQEATVGKRDESRRTLQRDEEELARLGRFLPRPQQLLLETKLAEFFARDDPSSARHVTVAQALEFQDHLIVHWLNDDVIPVPRSEVFCALTLGKSFRFDDKADAYVFDVRACALPLTLIWALPLPLSLTADGRRGQRQAGRAGLHQAAQARDEAGGPLAQAVPAGAAGQGRRQQHARLGRRVPEAGRGGAHLDCARRDQAGVCLHVAARDAARVPRHAGACLELLSV